ncbi:chaperone [Lithospermum erythrorhizon]|uniref:Chaperone n=1 Tax=Lithospermum erythrorhizon TaxID=34254 RepID=A0AAV3RUA8_LITER
MMFVSKLHIFNTKTRMFISKQMLTKRTVSLISIPFSRIPFCTNASSSSVMEDSKQIVDTLISIFPKRPQNEEQNQQLKDLGLMITANIVENALKGFKNWKIAQEFFYWASKQNNYVHNCYTYNAMAYMLVHARQNDALRNLAIEVVNSRCFMSPGALGFFVRCLGSQGLVNEANFLFDEVKRLNLCTPNVYSYNCLLEAISKSGDVCLIESRLNEMMGFNWVLDKYALTPLLYCYCQAGEFVKAIDVFNRMDDSGWVDSYIFSILVVSFSKRGEVDKAYELIEKMENQKSYGCLTEKTCCVLIHGFVKEGRVDRALQLLDKMHRLGYNADISIYDVLIDELCSIKQFEKALLLFWEMIELGIQPDMKILTKLVSCVPEDDDIIPLLKSWKGDLTNKNRTLLFNSVLKGLIGRSSIDKAYELLRAALADGFQDDNERTKIIGNGKIVVPDTTSFETIISGLCQANKLDLALDLFRDMDHIGCKRSVLLYNNIIDCLSHSDRVSYCYTLLNEMKNSGFQPTEFTHNSIFGYLCRHEDVEGAMNMLRAMRTQGHKPWIKYYTLLVRKLCKHRRAIEACNFISAMAHEGFLPDIVAHTIALDGLFMIGEPEKALKLFRDLCSSGYCPDVVAYNVIIKGLCKEKRLLESHDLLNEMLNKGLVPSVVTYNLLIDGWCKYGDIDKATKCLSKMFEEKREPNVISYSTLIDGFCDSGRPVEALNLWVEMKEKGCLPNRIAYMALINGLCKCRKLDEAILYLGEMEMKDMIPDPFIYVAIIDTSLSHSDPVLALNVLKKMVQTKTFPDPNDKNHGILKYSVMVLYKDPRTSSDVKNLIDKGGLPTHFCASAEGNATDIVHQVI